MRLPRRFVVAGVAGTVLLGLSGVAPVAAEPPRSQPTAPSAAARGAGPSTATPGDAGPSTATLGDAGPSTATPPAPRGPDRTSAVEARRVDRVPAPRIGWYGCYDDAECATVRLPLDYDRPRGATTEVALLRVRARDQRHRIGTLFVNPGGPGISATDFALYAPSLLSASVLDRFDIVGFDPRGVGASEQLRCFRTVREQTRAYAALTVPFPVGAKEERAYIASAKAVGRACSTTGRRLAGAMSTAEVARDMDVLRRAVGDAKLSYLGFSYGSVLGQYYANMFPDRVRAITVDGVLDPRAWVGDRNTPDLLHDDRLRSADGSYRALHEILTRCAKAGARLCPLAGSGDPVASFDLVARRLRAHPVVIDDPDAGRTVVTYAIFIAAVLYDLYTPDGFTDLVEVVRQLLALTEPARGADARSVVPRARPAADGAALVRLLDPVLTPRPGGPARSRPAGGSAGRPRAGASARSWRAGGPADRRVRVGGPGRSPRPDGPAWTPGFDFPYDTSLEPGSAVTCTDAVHPARAEQWPALTARADRRAPYFGRIWSWSTAICARATWTVRDEDAYTGPFDRWTAAPVLVVGDYWDPATNYAGAVSAAALLPNSRLLSSDSWGHTAYGTSECVTGAVDAYLLSGTLPETLAVCVGDIQPFATPRADARTGPNAAALARRERT
ncbi:alpha/beta fold hydrolase [Plantactinospora siamensis]|uniref:Alpha/beta fold hydrolase n=1 Tax=Plantactinospora siamensis TaxID=555372 RepID=A0ABV6P549_9ACTN